MNKSVKEAVEMIEVPDGLGEIIALRLGQTEKGDKSLKRNIIKIAAALAAAVILAFGSVTAAALSGVEGAGKLLGFSGKEQAFGTAATYVVENAKTEEEKNNLANLILSGMVYDLNSEDSEVKLGLSGLRPTYTVRFKVGGYAYEVVVDARTQVVLDCKSTFDENWETYVRKELGGKERETDLYSGYEIIMPEPGETADEDNSGDVLYIVEDYYGLDAPDGETCDGHWSAQLFVSYEDPVVYVTQLLHGGYVYENRYDPSTGEFTELYVGEDESYTGTDAHRHEHSDAGRIGGYGAIKIAREEGFERAMVSYIADYELSDGSTADVYAASCINGQNTECTTLYIDVHSGEILQRDHSDVVSGAEEADRAPELPSAEAPDGLISDAEAAAAVLEREGASFRTVSYFEITFDELQKVYTVKFVTEKGEGNSVCAKVDAVSGEIME